MGFQHIRNIKVQGFAACVPKHYESNENLELLGNKNQINNFIKLTGIAKRHTVDGQTVRASDMCLAAAERLIDELNWDKNEIDCLIFVSQTADYIFPATSCILQSKLGLSNECFTLDISLGCSGWIHGMATISSLLQNGGFKKGILLAGDTSTMTKSPFDKSSYPLFGDAGTATALEHIFGAEGIKIHNSTEGKGFKSIIIPDGGFRNFYSNESLEYKINDDGIKRNNLQTIMDGAAVFTFAISRAPKSILSLTQKYNLDLNLMDFFIFHQANKFIIDKIRKKLKISEDKVPISLDEYGNTSCSSIPLTIVTRLNHQINNRNLKLMTCAFGVGLSWGSIYFEADNVTCPELILI